jgi:SHS2 domain-containing protein
MAEAREGGSGWPPGVEPVDHTADVGLRVRADTLASLFERTAAGMCTLIEGEACAEARAGESGGCTLTLESDDVSSLLVAWLRELLFRHQVERAAFAGATFLRLAETALEARVSFRAAREPVREIKGVTYHGLEAEREEGRWRARVIFDV